MSAATGARGLDDLVAVAADAGLTLVRAHPRPDRLHVDLVDAVGARVIGQWLPDRETAADVARGTEEVAPGRTELHDGRLLLQHGGADRRLRALPELAAGGELVVHRPERRAVVRTVGGGRAGGPSAGRRAPAVAYTKVVRPRRTADLVRRMRVAAQVPGLRVPEVVAVDEERGTVRLGTLPGRTLHDLLATDGGSAGGARPTHEQVGGPAPETVREVGRCVRVLHEGAVAVGSHVPEHDLGSEVRAALAIVELARVHGVLTPREGAELERRASGAARRVAAAGPPARALLHRDLHDKQVLVEAGEVGLLDVDGLALGDPALDLGNLLAHLDLRVAQGWTTSSAAVAVEEALLEGYAPAGGLLRAAAGYRELTGARLRALYAFRPGDAPFAWSRWSR